MALAAQFEQGGGTTRRSTFREALEYFPPREPARFDFLITLASHLSSRYEQLGAMKDLNEAIILVREAP